MKIFKHNLTRSQRRGLSVIEVLTSIIVALIGVFGVLVMIPFSVKQTQSGLDQDAATSMARNALSSFEAAGYKIVSGDDNELNWTDVAAGTPLTADPANPLYCIDPLGITEQDDMYGTFPFNSTVPLTMSTANLLRPDGMPFGIADARRLFRLTDDLVFEQSDDPTVDDSDLLGPVQLFNEGPSGLLNRQSNGAVSWCAVVQPILNDADAEEIDSYKFNILVFKDRVTDSTAPESEMAAAEVIMPTAAASPLSDVTIGVPLNENIRRNDWVMLINQAAGADPVAFRTQIAFARVSNLHAEDPDTPGYDPTDTESRLSLNGPDFDFSNGPTTYIVHLRDVVAVFARTIKLEGQF